MYNGDMEMEQLSIEEKARRYDEIMAMRTDKAKRAMASRTPEQRKAAAQKAIQTRWAKYREEKANEQE